MRNFVSLLAAALVQITVLTRPAAAESIQLERQGGVYMLPVRINNSMTLPFVLNSGASEVSIPADVFLTLTRTGTVKPNDFVGTGKYILADGSEQATQRFVLHELRVGDHAIRNVIASVVPVKGDPLLGQSFLARLPAWKIDNARHTLVLNDMPGSIGVPERAAPPSSPEASAGYRALLGAWLKSHKQYPDAARQRGEEGSLAG